MKVRRSTREHGILETLVLHHQLPDVVDPAPEEIRVTVGQDQEAIVTLAEMVKYDGFDVVAKHFMRSGLGQSTEIGLCRRRG